MEAAVTDKSAKIGVANFSNPMVSKLVALLGTIIVDPGTGLLFDEKLNSLPCIFLETPLG